VETELRLNHVLQAAFYTNRLFLNHPKLGALLKDQGREGGYLCVANLDGLPLLVCQLGEVASEKRAGYVRNAMEKAARLAKHPDYRLSRESRDPDQNMYGGAVSVREHGLILSFSGYPEHMDELMMLSLAVRLQLMYRDTMLRILREFPNEFAKPDDEDVVFI
jgi:hypothetical protein